MAHFLQVQACPDRAAGERHGYKFYQALRVCRACPVRAQRVTGVQGLKRAGNKLSCAKYYRKQVRGPGLSRFTKLSKYLNVNAKNVTNLLILAPMIKA